MFKLSKSFLTKASLHKDFRRDSFAFEEDSREVNRTNASNAKNKDDLFFVIIRLPLLFCISSN